MGKIIFRGRFFLFLLPFLFLTVSSCKTCHCPAYSDIASSVSGEIETAGDMQTGKRTWCPEYIEVDINIPHSKAGGKSTHSDLYHFPAEGRYGCSAALPCLAGS